MRVHTHSRLRRSEHGFDRPISPKLLTSPTSKDFYCIVEFLYRQIDPNYVMHQFEVAIPAIFKSLGYPYPISKTALYAVGSPHTWPVSRFRKIHELFGLTLCCRRLSRTFHRRCSVH